jgi:RIO-like serine/threonine protein kinase
MDTMITVIFTAHKQAYKGPKILHRDISAGNIILTEDGKGLLIDWDLCNRVENLAKGGRLSERTVSLSAPSQNDQ